MPWYRHKVMHRKRVTCELHDCYFRSMTIKHSIPKTAEVTHSDGWLWGEIVWASLADNTGQGKNAMVPSQSDAPEESDLWFVWQLFPLDDNQTCHSKDSGSAYSNGQLWEEIAEAWRRVHISPWEFDGNIRPTNWTEDSKKFRCSRKLVPSLPCVRFLAHRLLTWKSPGLIDEWF